MNSINLVYVVQKLAAKVWHIDFISFFILMRIFQNRPNKLHIISGSEKIMSLRFYVSSFVCK